MRRREFITVVGGAIAAWPHAAFGEAQRIAIASDSFPVSKMTETSGDPLFQGLFSELRRLGYVEGQGLLIERYSGGGHASRYADLAREVVNRDPDVIISIGSNTITLDFKAVTTTIPIVGIFHLPVEAGIVTSLAHPGGNITGLSVDVGPEQWGKRIQLLQQAVPQATVLGFLQSQASRDWWGPKVSDWGVTLVGPPLNNPIDEAEYRRVFAALVHDRAEGLLVDSEDVHVAILKLIVALAEKSRLPAIYPFKMFVQAGGLMSYGIDLPVFGHSIADMVGQILKGAKASEIPIRQPSKFELVINLKTAKSLGLTIPATLLVAADEVIE